MGHAGSQNWYLRGDGRYTGQGQWEQPQEEMELLKMITTIILCEYEIKREIEE